MGRGEGGFGCGVTELVIGGAWECAFAYLGVCAIVEGRGAGGWEARVMVMGVMTSSEEASAVLVCGGSRHRPVAIEWSLVVNS